MFPKPPKYDKEEDEENTHLAAMLDQYICQWCASCYGQMKPTGPPHHIHGRRRRWDLGSIISLCVKCHDKVHRATQKDGETEITKERLIALMEDKVIPARKLQAKRLGIEKEKP